MLQYVFNNGQMDLERLKALSSLVGRKRLVLDLSCRKKVFSFSMKLPCIKKIKVEKLSAFFVLLGILVLHISAEDFLI